MHSVFHSARIVACALMLSYFYLPSSLHAEETPADSLPNTVQAQLKVPLQKVGSGSYRKLGFTIYHATLWAPEAIWNAAKPFALELRYTRDLSSDTLADVVVDDIRDQDITDADTFARWEKYIRKTLPAVEDGDILIGLAIPGQESLLFFNGKQIAIIHDQVLSRAFFNIWLGDRADEDLREKLLKRTQ